MTWRVARSLDVGLAEINASAPERSKAADGSIGDADHSSRLSDHNPNPDGVVRARDFTHDPAGGFNAGEFAEHVRRLGLAGHPALGPGAYVIWNYRIASATQDGQPWDWEPYTGSNGHTQHVHVSVATEATGYDSTAPWGWKDGDTMTPAQEKKLDEVVGAIKSLADTVEKMQDREQRRDERTRARDARIVKLVRSNKATTEDILAALAQED